MRHRSSCLLALVAIFFSVEPSESQLRFSAGSRLNDPMYLEHQIRSLSDSTLFAALRADIDGLQSAFRSVRNGHYHRAYVDWGSYWSSKYQPRYVTQDHKFLLDTEMLKGYGEAREYMERHHGERDAILARAQSLKENIIHAWGDSVVRFDRVVDFNRELGRSGKYGFHYWGWSRPLLLAYLTTNDQGYLSKFDELFNQWYGQRNTITRGFPELDVVYYELGLGARNRSFIEYYLLPYHERPWQTHERMLKTILGAARWLYELERWEGYRPGNWQIHSSYMLTQIALVFPEFRESEEWLRAGLQRLREHLESDFFDDGGHSERAPRNYTLATYLNYRNLSYMLTAYGAGPEFTARIRERMGSTIDWWISMITPTGEIPAINDSHRGLFPAFILQDGAEFFRKPSVYQILSNLFGIPPVEPSSLLPSFTSRHMPASGFSIMRSDWSREALYLNINFGKWGGGHTHNDLLDFEIYAYGKALAVDAGLGLTYDDPQYTSWYRSSRAHNMVTVNNQDSDREGYEGENVIWNSGMSLDYFAAEHDGYAGAGVRHRRQIVFVKPHYWVVVDDLHCTQSGDTLTWNLHTPAPLERRAEAFRSSSTPGLLVAPLSGAVPARMGKGMAASTTDLTPGKTEEISWLALDQISSAGMTHRFVILLAPYRLSPEEWKYSALSETHFQVSGAKYTDDLYVSSVPLNDGAVETDARCVVIHREKDRQGRVSIVEGTFLRINGREVWKSPTLGSSDFLLQE